ncbi:MAG: HlyD family efflux transporter periplasmic adaptor subunit [Thermodesulfovibrionales bacterium]
MEQESVISQNILQNMSGGVMTIGLTGEIITFNPAAERVLGLKKDDVLGRKFAEVFFEQEGNDDFNQAILDAIYESSVSHNRTVDFNTGRKVISLTLTTSFLHEVKEGEVKRLGVITVFDDITELKKLQDAEAHLTEEIKSKHRELQEAYLKMEEGNRDLEAALKKVQVIRVAASVFAIVLFLAVGIVTWNKKLLPGSSGSASSAARKEASQQTFTVAPSPVSSTLSMTGTLEPLHIVNVTAPFTGKVREVFFRYGDIVKAGQPLLRMDTSEVEVKYREAKAAYIRAVEHFNEMENWDKSPEVARTQRSLAKTKLSLENEKKNFEETERLFKKGIVPANEYEGAKQQYASQKLDLQSAQEEIQAIIAKGGEENRKIARLEMENAQARVREAEQQLTMASVVAPVSGVVIMPGSSSDGKTVKVAEKGAQLQQGELLISIGDLNGLSVKSRADEVDVKKIQEGQRVTVTGDAFPETPLNGRISSISSQASSNNGQGMPSFEITVAIDELTPQQRKLILVGMSANLDVIIYEKPEALMVPVSAVQSEGDKRFVNKRKGTALEKTEVKTGYTTLDSVEVLDGLKIGDEIVLSGQ